MDRVKGFKPSGSMVVAIVALIAALSGTAFAAAQLSGSDLRNNSVASKKIKNKTLKAKDFSPKAKSALRGPQGIPGPRGNPGPQGPPGPASPATYTNPEWAVIDRNTEGSPVAELAGGPFFLTEGPPLGEGSLHIVTGSNTEKVSFGNQVDFAGDPVSGLEQVGYSYTQTGEDYTRYAANLPNVTLEINPDVAGRTYTSMVYVPPAPAAKPEQKWFTTDADADDGTGNSGWYFSNGQVATATGCSQANFCSLTEAKDGLGENAVIGSIGIGKGKDYQYQGSVDALQINDTVYDFEPFGVEETPAP